MHFIKKIRDKIKLFLIPRIVYFLLAITNKTLNLQVVGYENTDEIDRVSPKLYAFWHGYMWIPVYYYRKRNFIVLSSLSQDGEYMTRVLKRLGWQVIRGSSSKGGSRSLLKLYKELITGATTVLTPDGPTGPIYKVKPGIVYLQEKSNGAIIPLGIAIDKKIEVNSWDKLKIPLPFSKAVLNIGKPIKLPKDESIEKRCQLLEEKINEVQKEAEEKLAVWKGNDIK